MAQEPLVPLGELLAHNAQATEAAIAGLMHDLLAKCVGDLDACEIDRPEEISVRLAAEIASNSVRDWLSNGLPDDDPTFRKLRLAANLLNSLVVLELAYQSAAGLGDSAPRLVHAAWLVGTLECERALVEVGILDGHAAKKYDSWRASQHAKGNAQSRQSQARQWQARALKDFQSRSNKNVSAEAWAVANHQNFNVKADTLAKALRRASSAASK